MRTPGSIGSTDWNYCALPKLNEAIATLSMQTPLGPLPGPMSLRNNTRDVALFQWLFHDRQTLVRSTDLDVAAIGITNSNNDIMRKELMPSARAGSTFCGLEADFPHARVFRSCTGKRHATAHAE